MNYGIIQNRRHDKKRNGGTGMPSAFLNDARLRETAKQMGLDAKDFGEDAQNLWQLLDDMASNDPNAYQHFIHEQLKDGPPVAPPQQREQDHSSSSGKESNQTTHDGTEPKQEKRPGGSIPLPRYFTPYPGFVVKCSMYHTIKCQQRETKLFLNCCAHEMVDMPKNPNNGKDVPNDTRAVPSTSNLEIPLVVGKLREIQDFAGGVCVAIDVVFHPWVMERCGWDANFKREVMKLAIQWVQQDAKVRLVTQVGKFIKSRYKGGVAVGSEIITAKFLVDPSQSNSNDDSQKDGNEERKRASLSMDTPSDLLKQINLRKKEESEMDAVSDVLIAPASETSSSIHPAAPVAFSMQTLNLEDKVAASDHPSQSKDVTKKKKLIEVLEPSSSSSKTTKKTEPKAERKSTTTKPKSSAAVKKGFLNSAKTQLYPTGSTEGKASSPYVNLLSRSKVVNLGEVERQKKQQGQRGVQDAQKEMAPLLDPSKGHQAGSAPAGREESGEVDCGDFEFEQLCMEADPDLKPLLQHDRRPGEGDMDSAARQLFGDGLEEISKLLTL